MSATDRSGALRTPRARFIHRARSHGRFGFLNWPHPFVSPPKPEIEISNSLEVVSSPCRQYVTAAPIIGPQAYILQRGHGIHRRGIFPRSNRSSFHNVFQDLDSFELCKLARPLYHLLVACRTELMQSPARGIQSTRAGYYFGIFPCSNPLSFDDAINNLNSPRLRELARPARHPLWTL